MRKSNGSRLEPLNFAALEAEISANADPKRAEINSRFFKTEKGEYGEGDKFLGLTMPQMRELAKKYIDLSLAQTRGLLKSKYHEERMIGLLILVYRFEKADESEQKRIFDFYIKHRGAVNNWDLIDVTTPNIVGGYLKDKDKKLLYKFAKSKNLWERRIAVLATFPLIREKKFKDILKIFELLLGDKQDLIHKAVGWMLREVGKRDQQVLENFLEKHCKKMPRTCLRYSIEKFPEKKRQHYLSN